MQFNTIWLDRTASTNTFLHDLLRKTPTTPSGTVIAAREQTAGRGRQNRQWLSAPGQNLCFSLFIQTNAEPITIPALTMAIALAVDDLLHLRKIDSAPKWPNDVLVGNRKICGILSERVALQDGTQGVITGIGLNINMTKDEADAIDRPATSMLIESGQAGTAEQALNDLLPRIKTRIQQWEGGGFSAIRDEWTLKAGPAGKPLTVHDGEIIKTGTLAGFGTYGELLLNTDSGTETIWSGDVS